MLGAPPPESRNPLTHSVQHQRTKENDITEQAAMRGSLTFAVVLTACIALSMTTATAQHSTPDYSAIIAAPDRTDADLQTDKRRDPAKLLAFTGAPPA